MDDPKVRQCGEIRFMIELDMRNFEILETLRTIHGRAALSKSTVQRWALHFRSGNQQAETPRKQG